MEERSEPKDVKRARLLDPYASEGKRTHRILGLEDTMRIMSISGNDDDDDDMFFF